MRPVKPDDHDFWFKSLQDSKRPILYIFALVIAVLVVQCIMDWLMRDVFHMRMAMDDRVLVVDENLVLIHQQLNNVNRRLERLDSRLEDVITKNTH